MLVIVEGSDFAGKSTVCKLIASDLASRGISVRRSTACLTGGVTERVVLWAQDGFYIPKVLKFLIFHVAYIIDFLFWRLSDEQSLVLQEGYVHRVLAYNKVHRRFLGFVLLAPFMSRKPSADLAYYLRCSVDEREHRYRLSDSVDPRDEARFTIDRDTTIALDNVLEEYTLRDGYLAINTDIDTAEDVARLIVAEILQVVGKR